MFLQDGTRGRSTSLLRTSIQIIQTDTQEKICVKRRNEEHLHGDYLIEIHVNKPCLHDSYSLCVNEGVIVYYGTAMVSDNSHMFVGSRGFQITDQSAVCFWQKSSPPIVAVSRKARAILALELR